MAEYVSTFRMPSEYERSAMEAKRRRRMAEMLAQQAYTPGEIPNAPIPRAAPFVQGLQAFLLARQLKKAEEAEGAARSADIKSAIEEMQRINRPTETVEFGDIPSMRPEDQERVKGLTGQAPVTGPEFNISPTGEVTNFQPMQLGEVPDLQPYMPSMTADQKRVAYAQMLGGGPVSQLMGTQGLSALEKSKEEEFGTTPVKGKGGKYYLPSKSGRLVETDVEVPEEEMTPYQQAQLKIEQERLAFQKSRAGQAAERPKPPSGYVYVDNTSTEMIPAKGGPFDPNRVRDLPENIVVQVSDEQQRGGRFKNAMDQANSFLNMINNGELPLNKLSGAKYATQRALDFAQGQEGDPTQPYIRYYELQRFVDQQVNTILSAAKGPQTEGDALRARKQILDNPDNEQIVKSALQDLVRIMTNEVDLSSARVEDLQAPYGRGSRNRGARGSW